MLIFRFHFVGICVQQGSGEGLCRLAEASEAELGPLGLHRFSLCCLLCTHRLIQLLLCTLLGCGLNLKSRPLHCIRCLEDRVEKKYLFELHE